MALSCALAFWAGVVVLRVGKLGLRSTDTLGQVFKPHKFILNKTQHRCRLCTPVSVIGQAMQTGNGVKAESVWQSCQNSMN